MKPYSNIIFCKHRWFSIAGFPVFVAGLLFTCAMVPVFSQNGNPAPATEAPGQDPREWCAGITDWIISDKAGELLVQRIRNEWPAREREVRALADAGDPAANNALGVVLAIGPVENPDPTAAISYFERAAKAGYPVAATNLGRVYTRGIGMPKSLEKVQLWDRKGAELGEPLAMFNLGFAYANGQSVEQSPEKAVEWYRKGAEGGNLMAMNNLGDAYAKGNGVEADQAEAMRWFTKAADLGLPLALDNLAIRYYFGIGIEKDWAKAAVWMKKAAEAGVSQAMVTLGNMHTHGEGMPQDFAKGVQWFRKASELGNHVGMYNLGVFTARGLGTPQSDEIAAKWLRRAMEAGYGPAKKELERLLGTSEDPDPTVIAKESTRLYESEGLESALKYLDNHTPALSSKRFVDFYPVIWSEAQIAGGRRLPEWGAELFRWLYETNYGDSPDVRTHYGDSPDETASFPLLGNLSVTFAEIGRMGVSRHYSEVLQKGAERSLGIKLDPAKFPDLGPLNKAFPEIRKRQFPVRVENPKGNWFPISDNHMRAFQTRNLVASRSGDWKSKAETAGVMLNWADQAVKKGGLDDAELREARQMLVDSLADLASTFELLGFHNLASDYAQQVLDFDWHGPAAYWGRTAASVKIIQAEARLALGDIKPELLATLEELEKQEKR